MRSDADESSIESTPAFTDASGGDFTTTAGPTRGAGRFGRNVGIGSAPVGLVGR